MKLVIGIVRPERANAVLEALACGLPVLSTRFEAAADVARLPATGINFGPWAEGGMASSEAAKANLGLEYRLGANGPTQYDCSSFTGAAWRSALTCLAPRPITGVS